MSLLSEDVDAEDVLQDVFQLDGDVSEYPHHGQQWLLFSWSLANE